MTDEAVETAMCRKLIAGMREAQAPAEQYERLGLWTVRKGKTGGAGTPPAAERNGEAGIWL